MSQPARLAAILFPIALALAWLFDFLFWGKIDGISFPIFVALALAAGFWLARSQGLRPAGGSLWLLLPIAFFGAMSIFRLEDFSLFLSRGLTFLLMAMLALSLLGGRWPHYGLVDYITKLTSFVPLGLSDYRQLRKKALNPDGKAEQANTVKAIGTGLLLATPMLLLLGALLSSADQFFAQWLTDLFSFLKIENLGEYLFRAFYILLLAFILVGVYAYALSRSRDEKLLGEDKPLIEPFVGFTEAATILVSVELLFLAFVAIQFRYFFGGGSNINTSAFTYADYARRGFGEMVVAVVIAMGLFAALSALSRREAGKQQQWFSLFGIGMLALVAVMLVSAYQRLLLYEDAYGFTRARIYPHTFMLWLGILLIALVVLEVADKSRAFTLAVLLCALGFAASLNLLNVDAFIVQANVERMESGRRLDTGYLANLSDDALPPLIREYYQADADGNERAGQALLAAVACHALNHNFYESDEAWQSTHLSHLAAQKAWSSFQDEEAFREIAFSSNEDERWEAVEVGGREFSCQPSHQSWD